METFSILLGGDVTPSDRLFEKLKGVRTIAADSGMRHASILNVVPELWVGDFDSSDQELMQQYSHVDRVTFNSDKDMTDGEIAIQNAIALGARKIILVGAFGGARSEHEFCHLTQAIRLMNAGLNVELLDGTREAYPLPLTNTLSPDLKSGDVFSILAFSELSGLTIRGAKWPLDNKHVEFGSSLTLSNQVDGALQVSLKSGTALLLAQLKH